jgi:hypothetical protein
MDVMSMDDLLQYSFRFIGVGAGKGWQRHVHALGAAQTDVLTTLKPCWVPAHGNTTVALQMDA